MKARWTAPMYFIGLLILAGLACLTRGGADRSNRTPVAVTPNTLPPQWTPTAEVIITPIPGWIQLHGNGVSVWLPDTFLGGDPSQDLDQLTEELRALGGHFAESADLLEANPGSLLLWATDRVPGDSGAVTNVTAVREELPTAITIQEYLDALLQQFPPEYVVSQTDMFNHIHYGQAVRLLFETTALDVPLKEVVYLIKRGDTVWALTFATGAAEFEQWEPLFDQSINTLVIKP